MIRRVHEKLISASYTSCYAAVGKFDFHRGGYTTSCSGHVWEQAPFHTLTHGSRLRPHLCILWKTNGAAVKDNTIDCCWCFLQDDPYVELKVHGLPCDITSVKTQHKMDTGRLIVDKTFELGVSYPEMAVLLILLKDYDVAGTDSVLAYTGVTECLKARH
jgi:hypothetical protein